MNLRVLGCYGGELLGYKSVALLINDSLLIDAGNISTLTGVDELSKIRYLALSHAHLDHIKALPFLAEQVAEGGKGLEVFGTVEVIEALQNYIFNGTIWPDLTKLPLPQNPAIKYSIMREGISVTIGSLKVKAIPVNHTVPAVGFLVSDDRSTLLYTGDTGPTERIWGVANNTSDLRALMIEVSYPNRLKDRAIIARHLTPNLMAEELKKIDPKKGMLILAYHLKPPFVDEIKDEICKLKINNLVLLEEGDSFEI